MCERGNPKDGRDRSCPTNARSCKGDSMCGVIQKMVRNVWTNARSCKAVLVMLLLCGNEWPGMQIMRRGRRDQLFIR